MIDKLWGTHLRHWLELPNTFRLLDRLSSHDAEFTSWHAGGCRVLACAVKASLTRLRYPGDLSLKILASNESPADHVIVEIRTPKGKVWYVDGEGAARKETLLRKFAARENRTNPRLVKYERNLLDRHEIQSPPYKLSRITAALCEVITQW